MPPEISPWDRSEFFRERKNERPWSRDVGARWRDRDRGRERYGERDGERDRDRERDGGRDGERDVRVSRDRHWRLNEFRRPNGSFLWFSLGFRCLIVVVFYMIHECVSNKICN